MHYEKSYYDVIYCVELSKRKRILLRRAIRREMAYLRSTKGSKYNIRQEETLKTNLRDLKNLLSELNLHKL